MIRTSMLLGAAILLAACDKPAEGPKQAAAAPATGATSAPATGATSAPATASNPASANPAHAEAETKLLGKWGVDLPAFFASEKFLSIPEAQRAATKSVMESKYATAEYEFLGGGKVRTLHGGHGGEGSFEITSLEGNVLKILADRGPGTEKTASTITLVDPTHVKMEMHGVELPLVRK